MRRLNSQSAVASSSCHQHQREVVIDKLTTLSSSAGPAPTTVLLYSTKRTIPTFNQRTMKLFGTPDEFRFYQRMSNDPLKASGIQFLTHFSSHHRHRAREHTEAMVDYLHWGKETGQAHMPHRHQRVAFDFNDTLHPTQSPEGFSDEIWWGDSGNANLGESSMNEALTSQGVSGSYDPHEPVFNNAVQRNQMFTFRKPQESLIRLGAYRSKSNSLMKDFLSVTTAPSAKHEFGFDADLEPRGLAQADIPGLTAPYYGEPDTKLMEAMSVSALKDGSCGNTITINKGRYSKSIYINAPDRNNVLRGKHCRDLSVVVDMHTNGMRTKLVVLKAAQSGKTDAFCQGLDLQELAHNIRMHNKSLMAAENLQSMMQNNNNNNNNESNVSSSSFNSKRNDSTIQQLKNDAEDYFIRADRDVRDGFCLLWKIFSAARPLMTITNGSCRNIGNGIALFPKYSTLRDSSEFIFDGPQQGHTPFGGLTHLLARTETTLKYPGLAEFVMLTGSPLYSGDVLRLGWTDLFSTLPDIDYHIKSWFDDSEHMHNDAMTWQLGHLLDTCFKMESPADGSSHQHATAMERTSLTPTRARWIEDAFADQTSVESILDTLSQIESLDLKDPNNTSDVNFAAASSSSSSLNSFTVEKAIMKLGKSKMHFSLTPWDVTNPPEEIQVVSASEIFRDYFFQTNNRTGKNVAARHDTAKMLRWQDFRKSEYEAFKRNAHAAHPRHIFARVEGSEGTVVDFEFSFADHNSTEKTLGRTGSSDSTVHQTMLNKLKRTLATKLGYPSDREIDVQWNLPTLDSASVRNDLELVQLLHADPGLDDPARPTKFPPVYFTVVRKRLHFSEWAYSVKHQMLLSCPFALKASLALLKAVRGPDGTEDQIKSVSESLATEFRYLSRMMKRPDFYEVGACSQWPASQWEAIEAKNSTEIDAELFPVLPNVKFDDVFERNVEIDGHKFKLRPRWQHKTVRDVSDDEIANLNVPLSFTNPKDRTTELHVPTETNMGRRVTETVLETIGYEVVPGLGSSNSENNNTSSNSNHEKSSSSLHSSPQPLKSDAYVPNNVNFYEMARHPWEDTPHSWRSNGFTEGSQQWFEKKYQEAVKKVYDPENRESHEYWPPRSNIRNAPKKNSASSSTSSSNNELEPEEVLLRDRFWGAVEKATHEVEGWAKEARAAATAQKFGYPVEATTPEEKIYDDEYYRWFIRPGVHPNPSGVTRGGSGAGGGGGNKKQQAGSDDE